MKKEVIILTHPGQVKRVFMEANGGFTLVREKNPKPGLIIIPKSDADFIHELKFNDILVCHLCGKRNNDTNKKMKCDNCGKTKWVQAVNN